ncbi:MAG: hypothetical protein V3V26_01730 [Candidatus Aenigmarchaeota archaeon]
MGTSAVLPEEASKHQTGLKIIRKENDLNDFMEEPGILVLDSAVTNITGHKPFLRYMGNGGMLLSTSDVAREMDAWGEESVFKDIFRYLSEKGCILELEPESNMDEKEIFRKLTSVLGKQEVKDYLLRNRYSLYKMMHEAMKEAMDRYFLRYKKHRRTPIKETWQAAEFLSVISVFYNWDRKLSKRGCEAATCMERSNSRCMDITREIKEDHKLTRYKVQKRLYALMRDMGLDHPDALGFVNRERSLWESIYQASMRNMLKWYMRGMGDEMAEDGSLWNPVDYGKGFWKEKSRKGMSRQRQMWRCTKKTVKRFCSGFDNDIELLMVGRYVSEAFPDYRVGICSTDTDIIQLQKLREALPY